MINTVLHHGLDIPELSKNGAAPDMGETLYAAKALVRYVKQSGLTAQLSKMGDTRFSTIFPTLTSVRAVYHELHELHTLLSLLEAQGESEWIERIAPNTELFD